MKSDMDLAMEMIETLSKRNTQLVMAVQGFEREKKEQNELIDVLGKRISDLRAAIENTLYARMGGHLDAKTQDGLKVLTTLRDVLYVTKWSRR